MGNSVGESARQSMIIMKNEIKKYFSGKRMYVFLALLAIIVFILAIVPPILGKESDSMYFYMISYLVVVMAATLFASISIVAEYEERTALIIFTRPVRKTSIFIGKALAAYVVTIAFMVLYYIIAAIVSLCNNDFSVDLISSFAYVCAYAFATTGIAMTVSAFMKKGSTSTIVTFVFLMVIFFALSTVLGIANVDTWWLLDQAANSIATCSEAYRDYTNKMLNDIIELLAYPGAFVDFDKFSAALAVAGFPGISADLLKVLMSNPQTGIWTMSNMQEILGTSFVEAPNGPRDVLCMIAWGVLGFVIAFIKFLKREF